VNKYLCLYTGAQAKSDVWTGAVKAERASASMRACTLWTTTPGFCLQANPLYRRFRAKEGLDGSVVKSLGACKAG